MAMYRGNGVPGKSRIPRALGGFGVENPRADSFTPKGPAPDNPADFAGSVKLQKHVPSDEYKAWKAKREADGYTGYGDKLVELDDTPWYGGLAGIAGGIKKWWDSPSSISKDQKMDMINAFAQYMNTMQDRREKAVEDKRSAILGSGGIQPQQVAAPTTVLPKYS